MRQIGTNGEVLMAKTKLPLIIATITLLVLTAGCSSSQVGPQVGKIAPDFTLTSLNGETISLSALKGNTVLLNFWATWCGPCRYELPFLQEIFEEHSVKGLIVLTINSWEDRNTAREFMTQNQFTFPVLMDYPAKEVAQTYQIRNIPTTFIIGKKGTIKAVKIGAFQSKAEIESLLKGL